MKKSILIVLCIFTCGISGYQLWHKSLNTAYLTGHTIALAASEIALAKQRSKYEKKLKNQDDKYKNQIKNLNNKHAKKSSDLKEVHKSQLAKAKQKARIKAKMQRSLAAIPGLGWGTLAYFEKQDFDEWQLDNPQGSLEEYSQEIAIETNKVLKQQFSEFQEPTGSLILSLKSIFNTSG